MANSDLRMFFAIPVPDKILHSLDEARRRLIKDERHREGWEFLWTPKDQLHITVKFLGPCSSKTLPHIVKSARSILLKEGQPFTLGIRQVGCFPDIMAARVLFAGVQTSRELIEIKDLLDQTLTPLGYPAEEREFIPHLTLARIRKSRSLKDFVSPFIRKDFGELDVKEIVLYESRPAGRKSKYVPVERFALAHSVD